MRHDLKICQIQIILRFENHFNHEPFLQHFEGLSSFVLNNLGNELGNE